MEQNFGTSVLAYPHRSYHLLLKAFDDLTLFSKLISKVGFQSIRKGWIFLEIMDFVLGRHLFIRYI